MEILRLALVILYLEGIFKPTKTGFPTISLFILQKIAKAALSLETKLSACPKFFLCFYLDPFFP